MNTSMHRDDFCDEVLDESEDSVCDFGEVCKSPATCHQQRGRVCRVRLVTRGGLTIHTFQMGEGLIFPMSRGFPDALMARR